MKGLIFNSLYFGKIQISLCFINDTNQSDIVKCRITSIYYAPTNLRICSYSWDTRVAISQHYCRCQTASATAQISKRICCARSLSSTRLYLLWLGLNYLKSILEFSPWRGDSRGCSTSVKSPKSWNCFSIWHSYAQKPH